MRLITLEEHYRSPALADAHETTGAPLRITRAAAFLAKLDDLDGGRLADMDAGDIDVQVISHNVPAAEAFPAERAVPLAQEVNDYAAAAVARHPHRFRAFAALPMRAPAAAADELERAVRELGFCGALIHGTTAGRFLDDRAFRPVCERAERLGVPLYLHPAEPPEAVRTAYFGELPTPGGQLLATAAWGWHVETGLHVLRMIVAGTFDEFPGLQLIIGHMGEALPFLLARASRVLTQAGGLERPLEAYVEANLHFTTSGLFTHAPLQCLLDVAGADRVLFSVDYPFSSNAEGRDFILGASLSAADRHKLAHGNAERLLGIAPVP